MSVLKFVAGCSDNYHHSILVRLSEHSRTTGLELLAASSDYDLTQQRFFRSLSLLCTIASFSATDLTTRPRSETTPTFMRSRIDSTSARVFRTLTSAGTAASKRFDPPANEIDEIFSALWNSLEHWFDLIKDEIHRMPKTRSSSAGKSESDASEDGKEDQDIDTRRIASQLVRSKPVDVSVRPKSTASLDSIRMSQPAVEFNLTRQCAEHGVNRGLYRDISRRLYNSYQDQGGLARPHSDLTEESSNDSLQDTTPGDNRTQSPLYENALISRDSDFISLSPSASSHSESRVESEVANSSATAVDDGTDLEREYLMSYAADRSESNEMPALNTLGMMRSSLEDGVPRIERGLSGAEQSQMRSDHTNYPLVGRSISYTYAIGESSAQEETLPAEGVYQFNLNHSFSRSLSMERNSLENSQNSTKDNDTSSENGKYSMVERFADRLCAVVHGYHLVSYSRPYWESSR